jgi:hypothetical protein
MENVVVITLDHGRSYLGARSLVCDCWRALGGAGGCARYRSQEEHNANAHEHVDGQKDPKEKTDISARDATKTWCGQKYGKSREETRTLERRRKEEGWASEDGADGDAHGCLRTSRTGKSRSDANA